MKTEASNPSTKARLTAGALSKSSISQNASGVKSDAKKSLGGYRTVRDALGHSDRFTQEMFRYFKELKQDVEGISKKRSQEKFYNDAVAFIRSHYAQYQLGLNPKVWATQFSSLLAAGNILDMSSIIKGVGVSGKDVDEYCRLAWLRNRNDTAAQAQAVSSLEHAWARGGKSALQKARGVAMLPIGVFDRIVITHLFGACQVQIEKNGGAKVGTKENKIEAGKLLQRVILETQQNSLATERSAAMRSGDELLRGFTMFSADAMKVGARFMDAYGELSMLRAMRKDAKRRGDTEAVKRLNVQIKRAKKQCARSMAVIVGNAMYGAALAYLFKLLYNKADEEDVGTVLADFFGNMLGGIPFVRDLYGFFNDGFEMDHFVISTVNDVLGAANDSRNLLAAAISGKEISRTDALSVIRKMSYAAGQLSGLPVRNLYNVGVGLTRRVSPETGYAIDGMFYQKAYSADLKAAIEKGDNKMVATIAGLIVDENFGGQSAATRTAARKLISAGYRVLPRSVGDTVTVDGEEYELSAAQQKKFRKIYDIADRSVDQLTSLSAFQKADEAVQAKAMRFLYDAYYELALSDTLELDLATKNILFAEAIDLEQLAIIVATARAIKADTNKDGTPISGSRKKKITAYVESLRVSAATKYMIMGYLGYKNVHGQNQVEAHINRLSLTGAEKVKLLEYSGYDVA